MGSIPLASPDPHKSKNLHTEAQVSGVAGLSCQDRPPVFLPWESDGSIR